MPRKLLVAILGLLLAPAVIGSALLLAPRIRIASSLADLIAFAGATLTSLLSLVILSRGQLPRWSRVALGVAAPALVAAVAYAKGDGAWSVVAVAACLIVFGHVLGDLIGGNIEHPGHLLPACVVVSIVDITSVLHPSGPSHAVLASERALAVMVVSFPVLGTHDVAPTIGVGDLLFIALLLAAARRHSLPWIRVAVLIAAGIAVAGAASAWLNAGVPALPAIGLAVAAGVRDARKLRPKDRKTATIIMVGAAVVAAALVASRYLPTLSASP
ncbi:MAG: hypothetical protein HY898_18050 [Deltaproteobacteria bacterium]|nr:hypothetical protein [Deltaproteobacteria bacterium]